MSGLGTGLGLRFGRRPRLAVSSLAPLLMIVAGQSNAIARGTSGEAVPSRYAALQPAFIWTGTAFDAYQAGVNAGVSSYPTAWGVEAEFISRLRTQSNRAVYIVKEAVSGTPIQPGSGTDWHPASGELFASLSAKVQAARNWLAQNGVATPVDLTVWCQGEADMVDSASANAYQSNFTALIAAWRQSISTGLFLVERTRLPGHEPARYAGGYAVRRAQHAVVVTDGNAAIIDLDFQDDGFANLHPGTAWVTGRAERAFAAWRGAYAAEFGSIDDQAPNPFIVPAIVDADPNVTVVSAAIAVTGFQKASPLTLDNGEVRIFHPDGTLAVDWTAGPTMIDKFQTFQLRRVTASTFETERTTLLTIGGTSASWKVRTRASSVTYQTETQAFLDRAVAIGAPAFASDKASALDAFVSAAKSGGWWTDLGSAFLFAIPSIRNTGRINLRHPANALAQEIGTMMWSPTLGFDPEAQLDTTLDLQFDPSSYQNAVAIAAWYSEMSASGQYDFRSTSGSGNLFGMYVDNAGSWRFNLNNVNATRSGLTTQLGFRMAVRSGAAQVAFYGPLGTQIDAATTSSGTPSGTDVRLGKSGTTANRAIAATLLFAAAPDAAKAQSIRNALNVLGVAWGWPGAA